jgi:hypothetical protein
MCTARGIGGRCPGLAPDPDREAYDLLGYDFVSIAYDYGVRNETEADMHLEEKERTLK